MNFLDNLVNTSKVYYVDKLMENYETGMNTPDYTNYDWSGKFLEGNYAFLFYESWAINQKIRPAAKFDFGMLPLPKGNSATSYCSPSPYGRVWTMTSTNTNPEKTAIIFNALARPSDGVAGLDYWGDIQDEYFQKNDTRSIDMYKLCLDTCCADLGQCIDGLYFDFTHTAAAGSVLFHSHTPTAGLQAIADQHISEIDSMFNTTIK